MGNTFSMAESEASKKKRLVDLALLFSGPISLELSEYLRKVRLAALFEKSAKRPHPAWRIVVRQPSFRYETEDYLCPGGRCGHGEGGD